MESIDASFGSAFIGLIAGAVLYGVTLLQTFLYYRQYPRDSTFIKSLVFLLWILDTAHLILCSISIYWYLVSNFAKPEELEKTTWSMNIQTDCNGLIGLIVECFFARRVWLMSGNMLLTMIIVILACVHFGLGIVFTIKGFVLGSTKNYSRLIWVTSAGLGSAAAADIIIAISLCYYLTKNKTGFTRTDSLITTLIAYSLTTGLITSVIAFIAVLTFATMPTNFVWLAFFWVLGKCYVNSLLAALNSRDSLREKVAPHDATFFRLTPLNGLASNHIPEIAVTGAEDRKVPMNTAALNIHVQTVSKVHYDREDLDTVGALTGFSSLKLTNENQQRPSNGAMAESGTGFAV